MKPRWRDIDHRMSYDIYVHENLVNGKKYVGLTGKGILFRWQHHVKKAKYTSRHGIATYFHRAIVKYGEKNWSHKLLEKLDTLIDAEQAEIKWIAFYKSNNREFGYNLTLGGRVACFSNETRAQISAKITAIMANPDRRQAQSRFMIEWAKSHTNPFFGRKHSTESRAKISAALKGRFVGENNAWYGRKHNKTTRARMSEAAKKRCADPNWKTPFQLNPPSEETRRKMSEAKKGIPRGRWTKEQLLEAAVGCKNQTELAEKLGCTGANVSFLIRHFSCREELNDIIIPKPKITKEQLVELKQRHKTNRAIALELGCTASNVSILMKKFNL